MQAASTVLGEEMSSPEKKRAGNHDVLKQKTLYCETNSAFLGIFWKIPFFLVKTSLIRVVQYLLTPYWILSIGAHQRRDPTSGISTLHIASAAEKMTFPAIPRNFGDSTTKPPRPPGITGSFFIDQKSEIYEDTSRATSWHCGGVRGYDDVKLESGKSNHHAGGLQSTKSNRGSKDILTIYFGARVFWSCAHDIATSIM